VTENLIGTTEALATQSKVSEKLIEDWKTAPAWAEGTGYPKIRQEFLDEVKTYSAGEQAQMKHALAVAEDAHMGQMRMVHIDNPVRDPYIIHPVRSALILMKEAGVRDADTISSAVLHDVVEDSGGRYTSADMGSRFGATVKSTVGFVTKPETIGGIKPDLGPYYAGVESAPEPVRLVKLADRLDNMRDTATIPDPVFQKRKLAETIDHYLPIAEKTSKFFTDQLTQHTQNVTKMLSQSTSAQLALG
jgi:(p)ppGpp synthase/HD superfamily hydrolase